MKREGEPFYVKYSFTHLLGAATLTNESQIFTMNNQVVWSKNPTLTQDYRIEIIQLQLHQQIRDHR